MISHLKPWNPDAEKIIGSVFGKHTLMTLYKMNNDKVFDRMVGEINMGKEANLFAAERSDGTLIALKIYRIENADFKNIMPYIAGDERFRSSGRSKRAIIFTWAKKEFSNLSRLEQAGVRVPHPISFRNNVLAMEFIGEDSAAETMRTTKLEDPKSMFGKIVTYMKKAYREAKLVHADLSEYNVLVHHGEPVIIDCGQAVLLSHPKAQDFLERDVRNICKFFSKKGVKADEEKVMKEVTG